MCANDALIISRRVVHNSSARRHGSVWLEFPGHKVENNALTLLPLFGRISRCTESIYVSHKRALKAEKAPLEQYFTMKVSPLSVSCTTNNLDL